MSPDEGVHSVLRCYPKIYFACHMRHVRDDRTNRTLSAHQASILDHLDSVEPTAVHKLAAHMGVTASTMSIHLDRLESGGYVTRTRDAEDARRVLVRLTRAGVRIKQQQKVLDPELIETMLEQLPKRELTEAIRGLELLAQAAAQMMEARSKTRSATART